MKPNELRERADEFAKLLIARRGPAKVQLDTGYRVATFTGQPQGDVLKVTCTCNLPGKFPDNQLMSRFIETMVMILIGVSRDGDYRAMHFDVPMFGERMIMSRDEDGECHLSKESIGGGTSCN